VKVNHLINIVYDDYRSKSNLLLLLDNVEGSEDSLYVIDKTEAGWVKDFLIDKTNKFEKIHVVRSSREVGLFDAIKKWVFDADLNDDDFIQVYAEDDMFMRIDRDDGVKDPSALMYIPPILFLYKKDIVCEKQVEFEGLIDAEAVYDLFKNGQTVGDSSWHSLIRVDIFKLNWQWIDSLPLILWNASNQSIWTALYFGKISRLNSFIFVKDSEPWAGVYQSSNKMMGQYQNLFGDPFLYVYDHKLYYLGCLANLFWLDLNNDRGINHNLIAILIKMICKRPSIRNANIFLSNGRYWRFWINYFYIKIILFFDRILKTSFGVTVFNKNFVKKIFHNELDLMPKNFDGLTSYYRTLSERWLSK
jgi:hypothetical protein